MRLEIAKNNTKILLRVPVREDALLLRTTLDNYAVHFGLVYSVAPKAIGSHHLVVLKLAPVCDAARLTNHLARQHPDWLLQCQPQDSPDGSQQLALVAETVQRQSGLFQLRIPDTGVLPVSPVTLAKIHGVSPYLQYSVAPVLSAADGPLLSPPVPMHRRYEDWVFDSVAVRSERVFTDPGEARDVAAQLDPPLGDGESDVFLGRLDSQLVTLACLYERLIRHGPIRYLRLCNRLVTREDKGAHEKGDEIACC